MCVSLYLILWAESTKTKEDSFTECKCEKSTTQKLPEMDSLREFLFIMASYTVFLHHRQFLQSKAIIPLPLLFPLILLFLQHPQLPLLLQKELLRRHKYC